MIELFTRLLSKSPVSHILFALRVFGVVFAHFVTFSIIIYLLPLSWLTSPPSWLAIPFFILFALIGLASVGVFYNIGLIKPKPKKKTKKHSKMEA